MLSDKDASPHRGCLSCGLPQTAWEVWSRRNPRRRRKSRAQGVGPRLRSAIMAGPEWEDEGHDV